MTFTPQKEDIAFMEEALKEAHSAWEEEEIPIGCVIVADNTIIARGHNLTERLKDPTSHAEMQAITAATAYVGGKYLNRCTLYVTVEPCPMCAAATAWAQIKRVVYGCKEPVRGSSNFSPSLYHPKTEVIGGVLEKECALLMEEFFKKRRR